MHKSNWRKDGVPVSKWSRIKCVKEHVIKINLSSNRLTGKLPVAFYNYKFLKELSLNGNELCGEVDWATICLLSELVVLDLGSNELTGSLPWIEIFQGLMNLKTLNLCGNRFTGNFPTTDNQKYPRLEFFDVHGNLLEGIVDLCDNSNVHCLLQYSRLILPCMRCIFSR